MDQPAVEKKPFRPEYKKISLYSAETKKAKCVMIKKSNFNSPEELEAYCDKLKAEQKAKNAAFKNAKVREKIENALSGDIKTAELPPVEMVQKFESSSDIDLNIARNTGTTIVLYGSSKRGKSTLMMYLYNKYYSPKGPSGDEGKKYICSLFSGNPQIGVYGRDKNLLVSYGFNTQSEKYIQLEQYVNVKTSNRYRFLNMFDDIIEQKYSRVLNRSILTYRNSNISTIICLQYVYLLSKQNRANVNHSIVFGSNTAEDEKSIIDTLLRPYFSTMGLSDYRSQVGFYRAVTANHGFIYLDNLKNKMTFHRLIL